MTFTWGEGYQAMRWALLENASDLIIGKFSIRKCMQWLSNTRPLASETEMGFYEEIRHYQWRSFFMSCWFNVTPLSQSRLTMYYLQSQITHTFLLLHRSLSHLSFAYLKFLDFQVMHLCNLNCSWETLYMRCRT